MGDITITSTGTTSTYALDAPITNPGNIEFLNNNGTTSGVLILGANAANDAFNITTTSLNGYLATSANFGGSILNFEPGAYGIPGDQITITHVASLFSELDVSGTAAADDADFTSKVTDGAGLLQYELNPDGSLTNVVGDAAFTFSATEIHILDEIEQAVFGTAAAADGATLDLTFFEVENPNANNKYADLQITTDTAINPCFAEGTRILTPKGEIPVENLKPGDLLITHDGQEHPILWIGRRTINLATHARPDAVRPIIIEPEALGPAMPSRRLILSPDHALYLDGVLVPAKELLNWSSIRQDEATPSVTYLHLELARHSVIFAENTPAETFLDTGHRNAFDNAPMTTDLATMQQRRTTQSCAALCLSGPALAKIRQRIAARQVGVRLG